ncbi:hypothetical protein WMY93_023483 [Mugilogobius chulae]|uniref:Secreted protein n=1 Tax=Mugilogobius chulae TaxID=88201 RepID=A0AAW0NEB5_9GOBI
MHAALCLSLLGGPGSARSLASACRVTGEWRSGSRVAPPPQTRCVGKSCTGRSEASSSATAETTEAQERQKGTGTTTAAVRVDLPRQRGDRDPRDPGTGSGTPLTHPQPHPEEKPSRRYLNIHVCVHAPPGRLRLTRRKSFVSVSAPHAAAFVRASGL